ncbi:hypothetical protein ACHHYP_12428 [Achlya hypogyna]|uniref:Secreted protein n=1 Tax=Achlya hypogyna TaxID=1202772 RepID=A0A1V9YH67_ACHHY|nr:hypothetical protein ACHHYP_12428 [Achlya hypogyna]
MTRVACLALFMSVVHGQNGSLMPDGLLQETNAMKVAKAEAAARDAAHEEEDQSMIWGSGMIFVAGAAMLAIIAYIVYSQHKRNVAREEDNQLMKSLLDSEMDYAAM